MKKFASFRNPLGIKSSSSISTSLLPLLSSSSSNVPVVSAASVQPQPSASSTSSTSSSPSGSSTDDKFAVPGGAIVKKRVANPAPPRRLVAADKQKPSKSVDSDSSKSSSFFPQSVWDSLPSISTPFFGNRGKADVMVKEIVQQTIKPSVSRITGRADPLNESQSRARARDITTRLQLSETEHMRLLRLEELMAHLNVYPQNRRVVLDEGGLRMVLNLEECGTDNAVRTKARQCLALLGYAGPLKGRGIRMLSIDGGGTRGLIVLEVLNALEEETGKRIHELFDYVVGVSTGAVINSLLCGLKLPIPQARQIYMDMSQRLFDQNRMRGVSGLLWSHSYYSSAEWIEILRQAVGEKLVLDMAKSKDCPKMCIFSCIVNTRMIEPYTFRNYNYPPGIGSTFRGSTSEKLWEALSASAAAPGYFKEVKLGNFLHQDGGVLANNPTCLGIHEAKSIWGEDTPIECIVSIGTGRCFTPNAIPDSSPDSTSWVDKIVRMVDSATDTEMTHIALNELLPADCYYRFNPYCSQIYMLDEWDRKKMEQMSLDAKFYVRKNRRKIATASRTLLCPKPFTTRVGDIYRKKRILWYGR